MIAGKYFLLMVGEDGALLIPPEGKGEPVYVSGHGENSAKQIITELCKKPKNPVIIMADVLAQEIRVETLPPVGFFDRRNLISRRLKQAFAETKFMGCIKVEKNSAILAGLSEKSPVSAWLKRINSAPNLSGFVCILPVECSDIACALSPENEQEWKLLLSWQRTGGLRQIVTRNSTPVFTRLTPPLPLDASAKEIASTINRDVQATLDYLSRLGLGDKAQISITALLPKHAHKEMGASNINLMTPYQAAKSLGLDFTPAPDDQTSDILFAAWFMKRSRMKLKLMLPEDKIRLRHAMIKRTGIICATIAWMAFLISVSGQLGNLYPIWKNNLRMADNINSLQQQLLQEQNRFGPITQPFGKLREALTRRRLFSSATPTPWEMLQTIAESRDNNAKIMSFDWQDNTGESMIVDLQITNDPQLSKQETMDRFKQYTDNLQQALKQADHRISLQITRHPFPTAPGEIISNSSDIHPDRPSSGEIVIRRTAP